MKINQKDVIKFYKFVDEHDISQKEKQNIFAKFDKIMTADNSYYKQINEYMKDCKLFGEYNSDDLKEEIDDIFYSIFKTDSLKEAQKLPEEEIKNVEEQIELPEEEIEVIEKKPTFLERLFSRKKEQKEIILPDENIEIIEKDEQMELPEEEIKMEEQIELPEEEIEVIEKKPTFFERLFSRKKEQKEIILPDEDIKIVKKEEPIKESIEQKEIKIVEESKQKNETKEVTKLSFVEDFVNTNYSNNKEILDFINLIKFRTDKEEVVENLFNFINNDENANEEEKFLTKLYEIFGLTKKEEEIIEKAVIPAERVTKSEEFIKPKREESKKVNINPLNEKYFEIKNTLFNELETYEKAFINDMISENLKPGDMELDQMFNERAVNKTTIYKYLLKIEKINLLNAYEKLGEFEKEFVNDATMENIKFNDAEFYQMLNERCVNKKALDNYYSILEQSNNYQKQIINDYKKHIRFEASNLEGKKVKELKEIAKENQISKVSKLNKQQLIEVLNQLTILKEQEADKQLEIVK